MQQLEAKFPGMVKQQAASAFRRIGQPFDEFLKKGGKWNFNLQPLPGIHLHSGGITTSYSNLGDNKYVYIFSAIAVFIILLACINFMNLATAQSAQRAKEVGIRKVLGSMKGQLVRQFLAEALLYSCLAGLLALALVSISLPSFNALSNKSLSFMQIFTGTPWLFLVGLIFVTGLLAGSYPAFYLSGFRPTAVLKGLNISGPSLNFHLLRNGLVVFQFTVSTALIICTLVVYRQLQFSRHMDLGMVKDNVVVISNSNRLGASEEAFRQELSRFPEVTDASITDNIPTENWFTDFYDPIPAGDSITVPKDIALSSFMVDQYFIPTLGIRLLKGRNFSRDFRDSSSVIINEMTARQIGWKDPIGKYIAYPGSRHLGERFKVIGVVQNFNVQSVHNPMIPFVLFHVSSQSYIMPASHILARIRPGEPTAVLHKIEAAWKRYAAGNPFSYNFLNSIFDNLYVSDERVGAVFGLFTGLSLFVACLGLFGLAAFTTERRTREIGIRKVLGASVKEVVFLLSKDFVILVSLAALIAFPIAWWSMSRWLEDFAYRAPIGAGLFLAAGLLTLTVALATVSFLAINAALANPAKSLRSE
jgi:putative ABC transport system permease protein